MKTKIINGKKIRDEILENIRKEAAQLPFKPVFCDVLVGDDPASVQYVDMKKRTAESVGFAFREANFDKNIQTEELAEEIKKLNKIENMCGLIIQLPLPAHIDRQAVLDCIDPSIDVDCLSQEASAKFYNGEKVFGFPTALACMAILDSLQLDIKEKNVVVIGQGILVGKPVSALLMGRGIIPVTIIKETENKEDIIKTGDIIISGTGQGRLIKGGMIKEAAVIIDAGTSESNGGIVGDVDLDSVKGIAGYVSPVPGGVGPVTVAMLLNNVLSVAKSFAKTRDNFSKPDGI